MRTPRNTPPSAPAADTPAAFRVAYHDGPPSITFMGITWQRGVPQAVAAEEWAGILAREDAPGFDFRIEPAASSAPNKE